MRTVIGCLLWSVFVVAMTPLHAVAQSKCTWGCACSGVVYTVKAPGVSQGDFHQCTYGQESRSAMTCTTLRNTLVAACMREHQAIAGGGEYKWISGLTCEAWKR